MPFMLVVVFLSGYLVMALEILAFRIIQPFFGNSIYATGAVLGIVLTALTIGYWLGGTISVKLAPSRIQATALVIAGLWIFALAGVPKSFGSLVERTQNPRETAAYYLDPPWKSAPEWVLELPLGDSMEYRMRIDPLIGSIILFFVPSLFLAMVGPCAVRALTRTAADAGRMSGWVFALGSLGSIAGVLVTSFWLIAYLGIGANLRVIGSVAVLLGILAAASRAGSK
jgi:MFS family permease